MFDWGVLTVLCLSFLRTLITDILFTECREEPWCNFDIFSLRSAWAKARCHMLKSGRKFRDCGGERSRQLFRWCCLSSRTEYFCWWWQRGVGNCDGRTGGREFSFCERTSPGWVKGITLVIKFVLTDELNTFPWRWKNNLQITKNTIEFNISKTKRKLNT